MICGAGAGAGIALVRHRRLRAAIAEMVEENCIMLVRRVILIAE